MLENLSEMGLCLGRCSNIAIQFILGDIVHFLGILFNLRTHFGIQLTVSSSLGLLICQKTNWIAKNEQYHLVSIG